MPWALLSGVVTASSTLSLFRSSRGMLCGSLGGMMTYIYTRREKERRGYRCQANESCCRDHCCNVDESWSQEGWDRTGKRAMSLEVHVG